MKFYSQLNMQIFILFIILQICVHMSVCECVCLCECVLVCVNAWVWLCESLRVCVCVWICMYVHECDYVCVCVCEYVCMCISVIVCVCVCVWMMNQFSPSLFFSTFRLVSGWVHTHWGGGQRTTLQNHLLPFLHGDREQSQVSRHTWWLSVVTGYLTVSLPFPGWLVWITTASLPVYVGRTCSFQSVYIRG